MTQVGGSGVAAGRRFLLTCAVTRYQHCPDWNREELTHDVNRVVRLFCGDFLPTHARYEHVSVLGDSPTSVELLDRLRDFCTSPQRRADDYVVVYLTGHGEILDNGDYVVLAADTRPTDLLHRTRSSAWSARWAWWQYRPPRHTLTGHTARINASAVADLDSLPVMISASADYSVDVWDLATRRLLCDSYVGHAAPVRAIATGKLNGHPVVIFGGKDATLQVGDLMKRRPMRSALRTVHLQHSAPVLTAVATKTRITCGFSRAVATGPSGLGTFRAVVCFQRNGPRAEQWSQPSHFWDSERALSVAGGTLFVDSVGQNSVATLNIELESEMLALTTYGSSTVVAATGLGLVVLDIP